MEESTPVHNIYIRFGLVAALAGVVALWASGLVRADDPAPITPVLTSATPEGGSKGDITVNKTQGGGSHAPEEQTITGTADGVQFHTIWNEVPEGVEKNSGTNR
jgi:hypothetical protein